MTKSDTRSSPTHSLLIGEGELVFIYGHQWRDGVMTGKLNHAEPVGGGVVSGRLLSMSNFPVMVSDDGEGKVRGEVYRVHGDLSAELDGIMQEVARLIGNGSCRRGKLMAAEVRGNDPPIEVWTWLWENVEGPQELVASGDWLDRRAPPWFTSIALGCLFAFFLTPLAVLLQPRPPAPAPPGGEIFAWLLMILALLAPFVGLGAAWFAHRRSERMSGCLLFIVAGLMISSMLALVAALEMVR
ncbi:gamma-glutamylcyclotransferase family protein [Luteolibacter luteus]|uniref:Gamma-glutamylcyclotransferase n=1 Tax=Luteolibacter luteus TaxID=2728835 RepID=A0A858REN9_9BACT|nr:gamma-glutamylcyclotransferase family protein [Luteolibacter luteus]QJE95297.1 gamma-glutamylcyclotransferase [Luteolibacter luteus]